MCSRGSSRSLSCSHRAGLTQVYPGSGTAVWHCSGALTFWKSSQASCQEKPWEDSFCHLGPGWSMQLDFRATQQLSVSFETQNGSLDHTFRLIAFTASTDFFEYQSQIMSGKPLNLFSPSTCFLSMFSTHQSITHLLQRFCAMNWRAVLLQL